MKQCGLFIEILLMNIILIRFIYDSRQMKMGWGWDLVMNGICFLKKRPVIRDYNHVVEHDKGTAYNIWLKR